MGKDTIIAMTNVQKEMVSVLKDGWNKIDFMRRLIPASIEDGKVLNSERRIIGVWDGDDAEILNPATLKRIQTTQRATESLLSKVFSELDGFFEATEPEEPEEQEEPEEPEEPEVDDEDEVEDFIDKIEDLIDDGELKKAKKLLKANKEILPKADYKRLKKELKNGND